MSSGRQRELSYVLLRHIPLEARLYIQCAIIGAVTVERKPEVHGAAAEVVACILGQVHPSEWPELLQLLKELMQSSDVNHQKSFFRILYLQLDIILAQELFTEQFLFEVITAHILNEQSDPMISASTIYNGSATPAKEVTDETLNGESPPMFAAAVLDQMAASLPTVKVYTSVMTVVPSLVVNCNPWLRKAAMTSLAAIAEHCSESIREDLSTVVPTVVRLLNDPCVPVRLGALLVVREYSDYVWPDFMAYHSQILPPLSENIRSNEWCLQREAIITLKFFTQHLESQINLYLSDMMQLLGRMLFSDLSDCAVDTIAAAAEAAGQVIADAQSSRTFFLIFLKLLQYL
ncbi:hypothetical protein Pelo_18963 [Pelomyxa schiedti]|nr:hypothetical protein Pelo_18963 [Pelomyxa schiedti]